MTLSRNEKIAIGGGITLIGGGLLYLLLRSKSGSIPYVQVDYTGNGAVPFASRVIPLPFTPKWVFVGEMLTLGTRTFWWTDPDTLQWAWNHADEDNVDNTATPVFVRNGFDVGLASAHSSPPNYVNVSGHSYRLVAYS